ncbi:MULTISPECIES: hypothetical protein [Pseudomonas]
MDGNEPRGGEAQSDQRQQWQAERYRGGNTQATHGNGKRRGCTAIAGAV